MIDKKLETLHSEEPLCRSIQQRQLARQALVALKDREDREDQNVQGWADKLASDVANCVD